MSEQWRDGQLAEFAGVIRRGIEDDGGVAFSFRGHGVFTATSAAGREYAITVTPAPAEPPPIDQAAYDRAVADYGRQFVPDVETLNAAANLIRVYGHKTIIEGVREDRELADKVQEFADWVGRGIER
ncbi:hypothetical protein ACFWF7_10045 [Nocardia sp. NPDC060256]|uniref:hypothetical protein n=1 Tax=unclassified Nocardia TaxID=2637762 RepID=UPI00365C6FAD